MPYPEREHINPPKRASDFIMDEFRYAGEPGEVVRRTVGWELHRTLGEQSFANVLQGYASLLGSMDLESQDFYEVSRCHSLYIGGLLAMHAELAPSDGSARRRAVWNREFSMKDTVMNPDQLRDFGDELSKSLSEDRYLALASSSARLFADIDDDEQKGLFIDDFVRGYSIGYALIQEAVSTPEAM